MSDVSRPIQNARPTPAADVPRETPRVAGAPTVVETPVVAEAPRAVEAPRVVETPTVVAEKSVSHVTPDPLAPRVAEVVVERRETTDEPHVSRPTSQDSRLASEVSLPTADSRPTPAADVPRVAEERSIPKEGVDMRIEATTIELRGNPPVKVQILSSAGLAPLPIPRATATRFAAAMEDDARGTETPLVHNPLVAPPSLDAGAVARPSELAASAASARTEAIVETVNEIVETVVDRISVTPTLAKGEGEIRITLRPTVLDGSTVSLSAKGGELTVVVAPATPDAAHLASAALPRLEAALAAHAPAFHHVAVVLATSKKGKSDEIA